MQVHFNKKENCFSSTYCPVIACPYICPGIFYPSNIDQGHIGTSIRQYLDSLLQGFSYHVSVPDASGGSFEKIPSLEGSTEQDGNCVQGYNIRYGYNAGGCASEFIITSESLATALTDLAIDYCNECL